MALSNWDTLAFGNDGKPCNGILEGFDGQSAEIYKNWVYIHDHKGWHEGCGYSKPVIAEVSFGNISLAGFHITARHGPQNGIFVYVECVKYTDKDIAGKKETVCNRRRMAGIGCYGFSDPLKKIALTLGVNLKDYDDALLSTCHNYPECGNGKMVATINLELVKNNKIVKEFSIPETSELESKWIGVTKNTYRAFMKWLKTGIDRSPEFDKDYFAWLDECKQSGPLRFCQGDGYFANNIKGVDLSATLPGEAKSPLLMQMLGKKSIEVK